MENGKNSCMTFFFFPAYIHTSRCLPFFLSHDNWLNSLLSDFSCCARFKYFSKYETIWYSSLSLILFLHFVMPAACYQKLKDTYMLEDTSMHSHKYQRYLFSAPYKHFGQWSDLLLSKHRETKNIIIKVFIKHSLLLQIHDVHARRCAHTHVAVGKNYCKRPLRSLAERTFILWIKASFVIAVVGNNYINFLYFAEMKRIQKHLKNFYLTFQYRTVFVFKFFSLVFNEFATNIS